MKFGFRTPSLKSRIAARTSTKRFLRHSVGLKAPKGMGIFTDPKKAVYNKVYQKTTFGVEDVFKSNANLSSSKKSVERKTGNGILYFTFFGICFLLSLSGEPIFVIAMIISLFLWIRCLLR